MHRGRGGSPAKRIISFAFVVASAILSRTAFSNSIDGAWSPVSPWSLVAIHAVLMPDGRVLTYRSSEMFDVWDPAAGLDAGHLTLSNTADTYLFCSSLLALPDGRGILIAGGGGAVDEPDNNSNVFDYESNTLARYNDMNRPRWYSSSTTLLSGETYIQGGSGGTDHPEIRSLEGEFRLLSGADTSSLVFAYPRNYVAPDGRIFGYDGSGSMFNVDVSGAGSYTARGQFTGPTGRDSSSAMYRPGRILQFGGASNGARIIDITSPTPLVTSTQSLSSRRRWVTATILPNGRVLATGGSDVKNELIGVNNSAEIWNPNTGQWKRGAEGEKPRLYHSIALLLPDASVLVAGGGTPGPVDNFNAEIYYPPYLYDPAGGWAARPTIEAAPTFIEIGQSSRIEVGSGQAIDRVVLVKTGAVSHSFNMEQRFIELTFHRNGDQLTVSAPTRAVDAPPGYYLLFVLNPAGTPSVGRIMKMGIAGVTDPDAVPNVINPGSQSGQVEVNTSLQVSATDPNGDTLTYDASGLPPGLDVDSATGLIAGTPTNTGTFEVVVSASDGTHTDSASFVWTITQSQATFILNPIATPAPALAGAEIELTADVDGGSDLQFKWNFDDGTPETPYGPSPTILHEFAAPGIYYVTVSVVDAGGIPQVTTVVVTIHLPLTAALPVQSSNIAIENLPGGGDRLWIVNPDNDSVSVIDTETLTRVAEIAVGTAPRTLTVTPGGEIWVANKQSGTISVIDSASLAVTRTIGLPFASQPYGVAASPTGDAVYVVLEALGRLLQFSPANDTVTGTLDVGPNPRHVSVTGNGSKVYVSRFVTRPMPGESTSFVQTSAGGQLVGGEIVVIDAGNMTIDKVITLQHSDKPDFEIQGRGIPNYLGAVAISPDGRSAWVPSKQDNIKRGVRRDNQPLNFQNTVRAISSRLNLPADDEDYAARIDHDNSGVASAILHDRLGIYMFVALETSREIAIVDAHGRMELFRVNTGRAPDGMALSRDGQTLYVNNFMDRTIGVFDLSTLLSEGIANVPLVATKSTIATEKLAAQVLQGKRLFYDARDARLSRDRYISCASCHNDGGHDGRVWDLTGFGEGLRNTISLRGRATSQGFLHWSNNFDEVQDFEGQIRALAGGTGLMTNAQFNTGTRSQPLGDAKAGVSADLDALAAYVASLNKFPSSPLRNGDGSLTSVAAAGRNLFIAKNCASCHGGTAFTNSAGNNPQNIGTITADSGKRLGGTLSGIDIPTLRDVWATAPYFHLGSAATIRAAIEAHAGLAASASELNQLAQYVAEIGGQEASAPGQPPPSPPPGPNTGTGLAGKYFNNKTLTGAPVLLRTEAVNFGWSANSPGPGVNANNFSVRWTGRVEATSTGNFTFQTTSNDGIRLWINGVLVVDNWTNHATVTNNSPVITLTKNVRYTVTMEFYDNTGAAVARLKWKKPGATSFAAVPASRLYAN